MYFHNEAASGCRYGGDGYGAFGLGEGVCRGGSRYCQLSVGVGHAPSVGLGDGVVGDIFSRDVVRALLPCKYLLHAVASLHFKAGRGGVVAGQSELSAVGEGEQHIGWVGSVNGAEEAVAVAALRLYACRCPCLAAVGRYFPFAGGGADAQLGSYARRAAILAVFAVDAVGAYFVAVHYEPFSAESPVIVAVFVLTHAHQGSARAVCAV